MNKKFYLGLVATVGLFASCSSDDLTADSPNQVIDDGKPVPIEFNMGSISAITRGTGTVGTAGQAQSGATDQWAQQTFNIFMFEKGKFDLAMVGNDPVYNNAVLTAPDGVNGGTATTYYTIDANTNQPILTTTYYPDDGKSFDFWAYRADDAATTSGNPAVPVVKYTDATGTEQAAEADQTQVRIPFVIDGSQDLMVADPTPKYTGTVQSVEDAKLYSAYSARRGVVPSLNFKHLLTRLTFQVVAEDISVSDQAVRPNIDPNIEWKGGFEIQSIKVKSKTTGELIAAYKVDAQNNIAAPTERIDWTDADETWDATATAPSTKTRADLPWLTLQSRQRAVESPADIKMVAISVAAQEGGTQNYTNGYVDAQGNDHFTVPAQNTFDAMQVYDSDETYDGVGETGLPKGNLTTVAALRAQNANANAYVITYLGGNRGNNANNVAYEQQSWRYPSYASAEAAANTDLTELFKVTPKWNNAGGTTTYTWEAYIGAYYEWTALANHVVDNNEVALAAAPADGITADANYTNNNVVYSWTDANNVTTYYSVTSALADAQNITDNQADPTAATVGNVNEVIKGANGYFKCTNVAVGGVGDPTNVGEALLVAPNDGDTEETNGYDAELVYRYYKVNNYNSVVPTDVPKTIRITRKSLQNAATVWGAFEPGHSYNVKIKLYKTTSNDSEATTDVWVDEGDIEIDGD